MSPENSPPDNWVGDLNASYSLGPGFLIPDWKVKMNVSTSNQKRLTYNTVGILRGSMEDGKNCFLPVAFPLNNYGVVGYYLFTHLISVEWAGTRKC